MIKNIFDSRNLINMSKLILTILVFTSILTMATVQHTSIKHQKAELTNICNQVQAKNLLPYRISMEFDRYLLDIQTRNQQQKSELMMLGIAGIFFVPFIAPLFAVPGLFGAAAISSGLATLGGGSIAAGGFGMLGGQVVIGLSSAIVANSVASYSGHESSFNDFMRTKSHTYIDYIIIGDYHIQGQFKYNGYKNSLDGPAKITKNGILVFSGSILCDGSCSLLGKFQ